MMLTKTILEGPSKVLQITYLSTLKRPAHLSQAPQILVTINVYIVITLTLF